MVSYFRFLQTLLLVGALVLAASWAMAQTTGSATLRGSVKDAQGAIVPGADVTLTNQATREVRSTISSGEGSYAFTALRPGIFTLRVEMPGFKRYEQVDISVSPAETRGLDVTLEVGGSEETITVTSAVQNIKTETASQENTISASQIDNLSIISRSSLELLRILPGVVAPDQDQLESIGFNSGANANTGYNVNGLRGEFNNVTIDGSQMIDIGSNNGTMLTANPELVQEVSVQTSNYAAEYGKSGVQISAVTKGGGSEFHGTIYDYIRHNKFAANDRSNNYAGIPRPNSRYQYPGGNIGGPVIFPGTSFNKDRDKLFFFVGFEAQRQRVDPGTTLGVVPTLAQRSGDFSEFLAGPGQNLNQPTTVTVPGGFPNEGSTAPNNDLSPYIDPFGQRFINFYPAPNFSDSSNRFNYAYNALLPLNRTQFIARFDYNISDKTNLYVRLGRESETQTFARGLWWDASRYELPSHVVGTNLGRSIAGSLVQVFNPTMTNELVLSASRLKLDNDYQDPAKVDLDALGLGDYQGMFSADRIANNYAPVAFFSWGQGHGELWEPGGLPLFAHNDSISVTDNLSKVHGAHNFKFGVYVEQANKIQNFDGCPEGCITMGGGWIPGSTGNDFGDLLVGRPAQFDQATSTPTGHFRFWNVEAYAQDSWKLRPDFTFEYGVRIGYLPNNFERDSLAVLFSPNAYVSGEGPFLGGDPNEPNGILRATRGEIPKGITENPAVQFMPRLGIAWDIGGKGDFVVRAGGGVFYNRPQGNAQYYVLRQPPNTFNASIDAWGGAGLGGGTGLKFDTLREIDPFTRIGAVSLTSQNPDSIDLPRVSNMSLSIARKLPFDQIFEVAYVGTQGRHLQTRRPFNFIPEGALLSGQVGNADLSVPVNRVSLDTGALAGFRPFPAYAGIQHIEYTATSSYHSLQATLRRQSGGLQYYATYTFSKALGTTSVDENGSVIDPIDSRGRSYGILPYDRTHIFNLSYNYEIPSLARGNFRNGLTRGVFEGWQMSGITTFQSGQPIRLRFGGDIASDGMERAWFGTDAFDTGGNNSGGISPIYNGNPLVGGSGVGEALLNIGALQIPAFGQTGPHQPPFYMRGPSRWNFDVSFFKNFQIDENRKLQFRAGLFNLFNQAYALPGRGDIDFTLQTVCNTTVDGVPNGVGGTNDGVCDPTGGFSYTPQTIENFGRVITKHGKRIIEFALKFYF